MDRLPEIIDDIRGVKAKWIHENLDQIAPPYFLFEREGEMVLCVVMCPDKMLEVGRIINGCMDAFQADAVTAVHDVAVLEATDVSPEDVPDLLAQVGQAIESGEDPTSVMGSAEWGRALIASRVMRGEDGSERMKISYRHDCTVDGGVIWEDADHIPSTAPVGMGEDPMTAALKEAVESRDAAYLKDSIAKFARENFGTELPPDSELRGVLQRSIVGVLTMFGCQVMAHAVDEDRNEDGNEDAPTE